MIPQKRIKFINKNKSKFFETLKERVDIFFKENNISRHADSEMVIKSVVLLSFYTIPFILILIFQPVLWISLIFWAIMGVALAGIGMSIMHDANHGAYSSSDKINTLMGRTLNFIGGSTNNWKIQHNILHHTYTNITYIDEDIDDKLVLKFSPHTPVKKFHAIQWIYAFFFYGILTLYWVLAKDFIQHFKYQKKGLLTKSKKGFKFLSLMIFDKLVYFSVIFLVPVLIFGIPFLYVLAGFLLMHFIAGLVLTTVFQLAHTVEGTTHPMPDEHGNINNEWAIHQMNTTVNFATDNKLISWYVGGLNFQVEHHLFPRVCHVHYPKIAGIVKETANEFGVPYMENDTFGKALNSHLSALKRFGKLPGLNDAIG